MDQDINILNQEAWPVVGANLRRHGDEFDSQYRRNSVFEMLLAMFGGIVQSVVFRDVLRIVFHQHVIDQIGTEQDLAAGLHLAGVSTLNQTGNDRGVPEQPFEKRRVLKPFLELLGHRKPLLND